VTGLALADLDLVVEEPPPWWHRAACRAAIDLGVATVATFFPPSDHDDGKQRSNAYADARRICATCPVTAECLDAAMNEEDGETKRHGMRGGLCPSERLNLAKRRRNRKRAAVYDDDAVTMPCKAG
jgi:WhiB family redox-sensing transcriptional regulator